MIVTVLMGFVVVVKGSGGDIVEKGVMRVGSGNGVVIKSVTTGVRKY